MEFKLGVDMNTIESLPPLKKNLLLALPSLVIIVIFVMLFIKPGLEEMRQLNEELERQDNEIATLRKTSAKLPLLMAENKRLTEKLAELQLQLPMEKEVSGLLKQVSDLGIKSGLQIISWRPRERSVHPSKEVYEIPVEVAMRGTYHRFGQFFSNVTGLNRIVNIGNIQAKTGDQRQQKGMISLNVSFTAMTYSLLSESEKKELEKAAKDKK
ncbi:MAG: type 4a pilus biogenesis protein PilO [Nitrospirota bacterium]